MTRWIRYSDHVLAWAESALVLPRLCGLLWIGSIAIHNKRATSKHARTRLSQDPTQDACHNANISNETFEQWQADVKKAFREKNCYALSLNDALEWQ